MNDKAAELYEVVIYHAKSSFSRSSHIARHILPTPASFPSTEIFQHHLTVRKSNSTKKKIPLEIMARVNTTYIMDRVVAAFLLVFVLDMAYLILRNSWGSA